MREPNRERKSEIKSINALQLNEEQKEAKRFNFDFLRKGEYNPEVVPLPPPPYEPAPIPAEYSSAFVKFIERRQRQNPRTQVGQKKGVLTAANT